MCPLHIKHVSTLITSRFKYTEERRDWVTDASGIQVGGHLAARQLRWQLLPAIASTRFGGSCLHRAANRHPAVHAVVAGRWVCELHRGSDAA